jgi:hypothetical protein
MRTGFKEYRARAQSTDGDAMWARFLKWTGAGLAGLLSLALAVILLVDPYGVVPFSLPFKRDLNDLNQRYFYPLVVRQGGYDSLIIGTSSIRLMDPVQMEKVMGGKFANLGMNAARAWEQWKLTDLYLREKGRPRNLVIGLDLVWCLPDADKPENRVTARLFPEWMYDDNRWNDVLHLLNGKTLEISGRAIGVKLGLLPPRYGDNGYRVFTPPEDSYDLARARTMLWAERKPDALQPIVPPVVFSEPEASRLRLPALAWLQDILRRTRSGAGTKTNVVIMWTPQHRSKLPVPGSREAAVRRVCKQRIDAIARQYGAMVVDWGFYSPLTTDDSQFWDPMHYRLPIAVRLGESVSAALAGKIRDASGFWQRRVPPPSQ